MNLTFKSNFWGYFNFYYRIIGNRLFYYLLLSIFISFIDGIGLTLFIPLLQFVSNGDTQAASQQSLGQLKYIIDFVQWFGFKLNITLILTMIISLFVFKGLVKYIQLNYYSNIRHLFLMKIRFNLINNVQGLSYSAFLKLDAGRIQNTLTSEVARLFYTMTSYFSAAQSFAMLSTYIILAFLANYQFALLICLGSVLSNFIYRRIYIVTQKASIELSKKGSDFSGFLIQFIHYFKYLKSTNSFYTYAEKLRNVIRKTENLNRKIGRFKALANSIKEPIIITIVCFIILIQLNWMGTGLNTIILSLLLFYRSLGFLVTLQNDWHGFIENIGSMRTITELLEHMSRLQERQGTTEFKTLKKHLLFQNVIFFYDNLKALDSVNLTIPVKQTIAIVGESGSGKTTIANMIAGLFMPDKGEIFVDDTTLKQFNLNSYRNKIGYISQESVIFNDNIFNNVTFWAEPTVENKKRFNNVIEMASLQEFVSSLPEREFTRLGDYGILISGGQRQRISIARELFKNTEILILDEATSSLDSETEKIIQENIEALHGRYTVILIAHRLSTIKKADIIYLLENGRISASGSFDEMIYKSPRFKKMVSFQAV